MNPFVLRAFVQTVSRHLPSFIFLLLLVFLFTTDVVKRLLVISWHFYLENMRIDKVEILIFSSIFNNINLHRSRFVEKYKLFLLVFLKRFGFLIKSFDKKLKIGLPIFSNFSLIRYLINSAMESEIFRDLGIFVKISLWKQTIKLATKIECLRFFCWKRKIVTNNFEKRQVLEE